MLISNEISYSGGFAYHFHKPLTNWFSSVNDKQPQFKIALTVNVCFLFVLLTIVANNCLK